MLFVNVTVIDVRLRMTLDGKQMGIMGDGLFPMTLVHKSILI